MLAHLMSSLALNGSTRSVFVYWRCFLILMVLAKAGLDWAGVLVENLSGKNLGDFLLEEICKPCGVSDISSGFVPSSWYNLIN